MQLQARHQLGDLYLVDLGQQRHQNHNSKVDYSAAPRRNRVRVEDYSQLRLRSLHRVEVCSGLQRRRRPAEGYLEQQYLNQQVEDSSAAHRHNLHKAVGSSQVQLLSHQQVVVCSGWSNRRLPQVVESLDQLHNQHKGVGSLVQR